MYAMLFDARKAVAKLKSRLVNSCAQECKLMHVHRIPSNLISRMSKLNILETNEGCEKERKRSTEKKKRRSILNK